MENQTVVNETIPQASQNGVDSAQGTLPAKVIQASYAFTQTLAMENLVFQNQINGIVQMALDAMERLVILDKLAEDNGTKAETASPLQTLASLKDQLAEYGKAAIDNKKPAPQLPTATPAGKIEETLEAQLVESIGLSYHNAVNAQQQMYVTMQAAATMTITTILSVDTFAEEQATNHVLDN